LALNVQTIGAISIPDDVLRSEVIRKSVKKLL